MGCVETINESIGIPISPFSGLSDSEGFIQSLFSDPCITELTLEQLDIIIKRHLKCDDFKNRKMQMFKDHYNKISEDIILMNYIPASGEIKRNENIESLKSITAEKNDRLYLLKKFFEKLFDLLDMNKNYNCLIFRLLMLPLILRKEDSGSAEIFFEALKITKIFIKSGEENLKEDEISYPNFCENFLCYLSLIFSGFTKIIFEIFDINIAREGIKEELYERLTMSFTPKNITKFYNEIVKPLIEKIQEERPYTEIQNQIVTKNDFINFCLDKNSLNLGVLNYFKFRKSFLDYVRNNFERYDDE